MMKRYPAVEKSPTACNHCSLLDKTNSYFADYIDAANMKRYSGEKPNKFTDVDKTAHVDVT